MAVTVVAALTDTLIDTFNASVPGRHYAQIFTRAKAAGSEGTKYLANWMAPHDCRLVESYFIPLAAVSGAATNATHLNVVWIGVAAGSTELSTLELLSGINLTANAKNALNGLTGYTRDLVAGDVLALQGELLGTGLAVPEGTWVVVYDNV
jgi:hypothetical protein